VKSESTPVGYGVFVVATRGGNHIARLRPITLGEIRGNVVTVTDGLQVGDRVIVVGATLRGPEPAHAIRAAITRPRDHLFSPLDVITIADYDALATRTVTREFRRERNAHQPGG
jgi:hypothetical protein